MANGKRKKKTAPPSIVQLSLDIDSLKLRLEEIRSMVARHNDILQVQDNWHSRISKLLGKKVRVVTDTGEQLVAKLLWTDRYSVGLEVNDVERLYNKGHIVWIGPYIKRAQCQRT